MIERGQEQHGWFVEVRTIAAAGIPSICRCYYAYESNPVRARELVVLQLRVTPRESCTVVGEVSHKQLADAGVYPGQVKLCPLDIPALAD
jgi:hypothetical protein